MIFDYFLNPQRRRSVYIGGFCILFVLITILGVSFFRGDEVITVYESKLPVVSFKEIALQSHKVIKRFIGRVGSKNLVRLKSAVDGFIRKISVEENSFVRKGDVLVEISNEGVEEFLASAESSLEEARIEFKAAKSLRNQGYRSDAKYYATLAKIKAAEHNYLVAKKRLSDFYITAPFDGVIHKIAVDEGDLIANGATVLANIYDNNHMLAEVFIPELDAYSITFGNLMSQVVKVISVKNESLDGKVKFISVQADPNIKSHKVEIDLQIKQEDVLYLGSTVEVYLIVAELNAYHIDRHALGMVDGKEVGIKVLGDDNRVLFVPVKVIEDDQNGFWVSIKDPQHLRDSLKLITFGQANVESGSEVKAIEEAS